MKAILILLFIPFSLTAQYNGTVKFFNSLDSAKRVKALMPFEAMSRYEWHYLPPTMVSRHGIGIKDLEDNQKIMFYEMLKEFLSDRGYNRTKEIMSYEYLLKEMEPKNPSRIPENYFVAIYGNPTIDKIWGWKFSGHHLALNFTIVDSQLAFSPFFFGSYPAIVKDGEKKGNQIIKEEESLGLELINSLSVDQKKKATIPLPAFNDIVTTNSAQTGPLSEDGIIVKDLTQEQKLLLNKLIVTYLSSMPEKISKMRMEKVIKEDMNKIRFAWAGKYELSLPHYYRIQGQTFLIEFDNVQANANHVHTVWRDFNGDFGVDLLKEHYRQSDHRK